jgi:hypothetical protein
VPRCHPRAPELASCRCRHQRLLRPVRSLPPPSHTALQQPHCQPSITVHQPSHPGRHWRGASSVCRARLMHGPAASAREPTSQPSTSAQCQRLGQNSLVGLLSSGRATGLRPFQPSCLFQAVTRIQFPVPFQTTTAF